MTATTTPFLNNPDAIVAAARVMFTLASLGVAFAAGVLLGYRLHKGRR